MTLRTALIINGDSASGKKALDDINASMERSEKEATNLAKTYVDLGKASDTATGGHGKLNLAVNQNRIALLEFQHIARGSMDQIAAGAPVTQVLAQHMGMLGQAVGLAGGAFGTVGEIMSGPWGIAITAAITGAALLIHKHQEEKETLQSLVQQLQEHHDKTALSKEADEVWSHTLDGLLERSNKLNDALAKRLQTQTELQKLQLATAQSDFAAATASAARLDLDPKSTQAQKDKAQADIHATSIALHNAQVLAAQDAGEAIASISQSAKVWADQQLHAIQVIQGYHPELAEAPVANEMAAAFSHLKDAVNDAASANVDFESTVKQVNSLNDQLGHGQITAAEYDKQILSLAQSLHDLAEEAKNPITIKFDAAKNIADFKAAVFGTEGLGQNKLGSSAAGYGQFMPSTFESYFKKLFPQQAAGMTDAQIDQMRNVKEAATAVIEAATKDYVEVIKNAGQAVTKANLYAVHVLGEGDAKKFFAASPDQSVRSALGGGKHADAVIAGNPFLGGTVAEGQAAFAKRIGDSSAAVSSATTAIAQALQKEKERLAQFVAQEDQAQSQLIDARRGMAKTAEDTWRFDVAAAIAAHKHSDDAIAAQEAAGKLLPEEAVALRKINDEREKIAQQVADQRLREAQFATANDNYERGRDFQTASYEAEREVLQSEKELARTAGERRSIDQRLIDLQFQEEKLKDQYVVDWAARVAANKDATDKEKADAALAGQIAQMHLDTLNQRHGNATEANNRANAEPWDQYIDELQSSVEDLGGALQQAGVDGIKEFNDGLLELIQNSNSIEDFWKGLPGLIHQAAGKILADLLELAEKQAILGLLEAIAGGGSSFGGGFGDSFGAISGADFSGASVDLAGATDFSGSFGAISNFGGGFADGGSVASGTTYLVGERGPELFVPSSNGSIVPNHQLKSGGMTPANDTAPMHIELNIANDFSGASSDAVAQLTAQVDQMKRELPGTILKTMQNARTRFMAP